MQIRDEEIYFQKCVVHKVRNIVNKVRPKDKKEVSDDLKKFSIILMKRQQLEMQFYL